MSAIRPALSAEEWAVRSLSLLDPCAVRDGVAIFGAHATEVRHKMTGASVVLHTPEQRHAVAAHVLHGQPFGFTWDMVDDLRAYAADHDDTPRLLRIADRIAALLPPRGEG